MLILNYLYLTDAAVMSHTHYVVPASSKVWTNLCTRNLFRAATAIRKTHLETTPELEKVVKTGYQIQKIHEVAYFQEARRGLFESFVNRCLRLKVEASGWPAGPASKTNHPDCQAA